ncbi:unnamed protein product [Clonostachys solani]|uniref:Enoyl reductase (ER) domain-containing protein n=1 Tax=Clonostachys solani TaxID=160281 RepID=A0A9N9Z0U3_9HYPO|nr:unnamed protein product [Clonostachys solani]
MSLPINRGIFVGDNDEISIRDLGDAYKPVGSQALIKVKYSAINPADLKHSSIGLSGSITGYDWVGTVVEIGNSSSFTVGQQLFGGVVPASKRPLHTGAHQNYLIIDETTATWPVPKGMSEEVAATLPVAVESAADLIFNINGFGLPAAGIDGQDASGIPILIWGGASGVGAAAIQVAKAAGFKPIFVTASPKNHERLLKAGASRAFDYNSPTVVEEIRNAVAESGKRLTVAIETVCNGTTLFGKPFEKNNTPDLAKACMSDNVQAEDMRLAAVLPVPHDPDWKGGYALRPPGNFNWLGSAQDPAFPVRTKNFMDWFVVNHELVWKPILRTPIVEGVEKAIEEIRRVARGGASMEKVLIARPL